MRSYLRTALILLYAISVVVTEDAVAVDAGGRARPLTSSSTLAEAAASVATNEFELTDSDGNQLALAPHMKPLDARCQQSLRRAIADGANLADENGTEKKLAVYPDSLAGVAIEPRSHASDVRIVYFILASRPSAPTMVTRLIHALYHPSHLFLVHVDLKANTSILTQLQSLAETRTNVHVLKTRRLVQWGGFSMVFAMLDAIASFIDRVDFDFFINLADSELALRTNEEIMSFLRPFRGRGFVRIDGALPSRRHAFVGGALRSTPVIECGGFGFVSVNTTHNDSAARPTSAAVGPECCVGQSGPLVHGAVPGFEAPRPPGDAHGTYRGSQWAILPSAACRYLLEDPSARRWARVFERRVMADELYLPTVLMHSPYRYDLVNHNLRHEQWPRVDRGHAHAADGAAGPTVSGDERAGEPSQSSESREAYWYTMPLEEWGGARLLDTTRFRAALRSPNLFAKKVLPEWEPTLIPRYDAWMARKLKGEVDPHQPPVAAPLLRVDAGLYGFGPWESRSSGDEQGAALSSGRHAGASEAAVAANMSPLPPPRRVLRRRRIASFVFADGSACSCAPDCITSRPSLEEEESSNGAEMEKEEGDPADSPDAISPLACCAHEDDAKGGLCNAPSAWSDGGANERSAVNAVSQGDAARRDAEDDEAEEDEWRALLSFAPAVRMTRRCPVARFDLASTAHGSNVMLLFVNRAPHPVRIFHLEASGVEVAVLSLRAGEHAEVSALSSYAWRVRTRDNSLLLELAPAQVPPVEEATGVSTIHVLDCELGQYK